MNPFYWNGLALLPQRAVWREATRTLFVADVHIGKAATFRAAGLPAPAGTTRENLARLDALLDAVNPRRLIVLGDLFHARDAYRAASRDEFAAWRSARARLDILLVSGNHDVRAGAPPAELGLEVVDDPSVLDGLVCRHVPTSDHQGDGRLTLAGHVHPAARLHGPGRDGLRLPCFVMRFSQLVLPAFGEFTGGSLVAPDADTALALAAGDRIVSLPRLAKRTPYLASSAS